MSVGQSPSNGPDPHEEQPDTRLSLRWTLILTISAACGIVVGTMEGLPAGILAFLTALGLLTQIVRKR